MTKPIFASETTDPVTQTPLADATTDRAPTASPSFTDQTVPSSVPVAPSALNELALSSVAIDDENPNEPPPTDAPITDGFAHVPTATEDTSAATGIQQTWTHSTSSLMILIRTLSFDSFLVGPIYFFVVDSYTDTIV